MAHKPHTYVNTFAQLGAREFIFHSEATTHHADILEDIRMHGMKAGIAFNPETPISHHKDALIHADIALIMTVHPGFSGQQFDARPLNKIMEIRTYNPLVSTGIDGGVNLTNAKRVRLANADFACSASAILASPHPKTAYAALQKALK